MEDKEKIALRALALEMGRLSMEMSNLIAKIERIKDAMSNIRQGNL